MIRQAVAAAREDMVIRELLERAELREMCLKALAAWTRPAEPASPLPAAPVPDPDAAMSRRTER
jgi:hypothetical protein